uniref:Uncharacterized protein n=1 Tax=Glossina pallidipes TaxID=7398 RepID=A0A1A9ZHX6_GLOPL
MDTAGPKPSEAAFNNELPALFPPLTDRPPPPPLPPPLPPPPLMPMTPPCPPPLLLLPPGIPIPIFCGCVEELTCGCPCLCIPTGGIPPYRTMEIKNIYLINIDNVKTNCSEGLLYKGGPFWGPKPPGGPGGPGGDIPTGIAPGPGRKGGAIFGLGCCRGGGFAHGAGGWRDGEESTAYKISDASIQMLQQNQFITNRIGGLSDVGMKISLTCLWVYGSMRMTMLTLNFSIVLVVVSSLPQTGIARCIANHPKEICQDAESHYHIHEVIFEAVELHLHSGEEIFHDLFRITYAAAI